MKEVCSKNMEGLGLSIKGLVELSTTEPEVADAETVVEPSLVGCTNPGGILNFCSSPQTDGTWNDLKVE